MTYLRQRSNVHIIWFDCLFNAESPVDTEKRVQFELSKVLTELIISTNYAQQYERDKSTNLNVGHRDKDFKC